MCIEINNCKSVEEILDRYYKPDRYKGREVSISKHDNVMGKFLTCKIGE